jgi:hypothetical protein
MRSKISWIKKLLHCLHITAENNNRKEFLSFTSSLPRFEAGQNKLGVKSLKGTFVAKCTHEVHLNANTEEKSFMVINGQRRKNDAAFFYYL